MKIVPKILAVGLAVSLNMPRKIEAIPIVVAPVVCAKVCVFVGTAIAGGITSYVWHNRTAKKKYFADEKGNVRKMLDDPEEETTEWDEPIGNSSKAQAERTCESKRKKYKMRKVKVVRDFANQVWRCYFS